jgi:hypothetical protein
MGGRQDVFEINLREELGDEEVDDLIALSKKMWTPDEEWLKERTKEITLLVNKLWK